MTSPYASKTTRIFLLLFVLGGILWLGGNVVRGVVGFDVFVPGTVDYRIEQSEAVRLNTIRLFAFTGAWTNWAFVGVAVGGMALMWRLRTEFKARGWLLMAALFLILLIPAQGFLIWKDYELLQYFDLRTGVPLAQPSEILRVFAERVSNVANSMTAGLSILAAITVVIILAIRPLHRS
jgi:hypothetical protein